MKTGLKLIIALSAFALMGNALAASISIPTLAVQKGMTANLDLGYTGDATSTNLDFTINYDDAVVDEATLGITCDAAALGLTALNCSVDTTNNQIKGIGVNFSSTALTSANPFATITLPILAGAASGDSVSSFSAGFYDVGGASTGDQVDVPWTVTVTDGPQPVYASNPAPAAGVSMSGQISNIIAADVIVNNNGGEAGSVLSYTCTETADASNVFSLAGDTLNVDLPVGNLGTVSIGCDSSTIGVYAGEMQCTHNGTGSPATYALSCNVTAGPEPAFTGNASGLAMSAAEEGDADPMGSLTITNTGDAGTTLSGTCSLTGPDAQISMTGGGFSVAQGAGGAVMAIACDASAEGDYSNTLSCTHNGTNVASPATYPVTCSVGPPGPAVYSSTPAPGDTIEMTPTDVPAGTSVPDQVLTITNAAPEANDRPLEVTGCAYVGDTEISVGAAPASPIAPMASSTATFSCDSAAVGDYTGTYTCSYAETGGAGPVAQAAYPVHCGVRAAASDLTANPEPETTINIVVPVNGSNAAYITFSEALDEGEDATVDSCTLDDGSNFTITTAFPLTVPAGGSAMVMIVGTDPADGSLSASDILTCLGTDSDGTETGVWDLELTILTAAIPTLSTWGLLAMFLTMLGFGGIVIRRKERS